MLLYFVELHHLTDNEFNYYLNILSRSIFNNPGVTDAKIASQIVTILDLCWKSESKTVIKPAGKVFIKLIGSLTSVYATEYHSLPPQIWNSKDFAENPSKYWGKLCPLDQVYPSWFIPVCVMNMCVLLSF